MNLAKRILGCYHRFLYQRWRIKYNAIDEYSEKGMGSFIIMFHHVRDDEALDVSPSCKCTVKEFLDFLDYAQKKEIVSLPELLSRTAMGDNNMLVITFDDVPDNFYTTAYPILKERNIPFTLYIATGMMDTDGCLTSEQVKELSRDILCTIGAHTVNHKMLKHRDVDLFFEINHCKQVLEGLIGKQIEHFAYPYGTPTAINNAVIKFLAENKLYKSATTTIPGMINPLSLQRIFALPRIHSKLYIDKFKER